MSDPTTRHPLLTFRCQGPLHAYTFHSQTFVLDLVSLIWGLNAEPTTGTKRVAPPLNLNTPRVNWRTLHDSWLKISWKAFNYTRLLPETLNNLVNFGNRARQATSLFIILASTFVLQGMKFDVVSMFYRGHRGTFIAHLEPIRKYQPRVSETQLQGGWWAISPDLFKKPPPSRNTSTATLGFSSKCDQRVNIIRVPICISQPPNKTVLRQQICFGNPAETGLAGQARELDHFVSSTQHSLDLGVSWSRRGWLTNTAAHHQENCMPLAEH